MTDEAEGTEEGKVEDSTDSEQVTMIESVTPDAAPVEADAGQVTIDGPVEHMVPTEPAAE
jgi:hypothetical protein